MLTNMHLSIPISRSFLRRVPAGAAATDPQAITAIGVLDNNDFGYTNLAGVPLSGNGHDILIRFTYYGDADLNGVVDGLDYGLADNGFNGSGQTGWLNGDFDYDGAVTTSDFSSWASRVKRR